MPGPQKKRGRSYLNQDAIRLFEQALERLKLLDQGDQSSEFGQRQAHLFYQLGRTYYAEGQFDLAESALREAIAVGQASEIEMRTLARYYYWLGEALFWQNHAVELLEMAREGLAQLGTEVETVGGAMLTGHLAIATAFLFGQKPFVAIAERLAGFIRDLPFSEELSPAFHHAIDASTFAKNVERALELINALENRSRQNNDLNSLAKALFIRGRLAKMTGDFVASIAPLQEALRLTGKTGEATMQGFALEALLMDYCLLGRIDEARYWAEQIDDSGSQLGAWIDLMRGTVFLCAGDTTVAGQRLIRCMQDSRRTGLMNSLATHLTIGRCLMAEGKFDEAGRRMLAVLESADAYRELASNVPELKPALPGCLSLLQEAMGDEEGFNRVCNQLQQQIHVGSPHFTQWRLTPAAPSALAGPAIATVFDRSLTGPWIWHDPYGDCCHRLHDGLIIEAADGRDLWFVNYSAPRFTQRVEGDLAAEATCSPADDGRPTMGGLVIWFDRSNFVRMDRGAHGKNEITFLGCVDNENAIFGRGRLPGERITLRLERIGDQIRAVCRVPDQQWFTVGSVNVPFEGPYEIGIFACGYVDRTIYPGTPAGGGSLRFESFQLCGK